MVSDLSSESVPELNTLGQDAHVQQQVQQLLLELNSTSGMSHKLMSLRGVDVFVKC